ncbi:MAG TPA: hypothetical protein PKE41_10105, partial [Candidatus Macondimonas sp.]|nr:hypothetical protein [Candidatus Macondimonas sp.]
MAPSSQELEPPEKPGRFICLFRYLLDHIFWLPSTKISKRYITKRNLESLITQDLNREARFKGGVGNGVNRILIEQIFNFLEFLPNVQHRLPPIVRALWT